MITARRQLLTAAALMGAALATWIVTVQRMRGMDAGPGTDLGGLGFFVGVWVTMMAAMMLPSAAPFVLFHARVARQRSTGIFVMGYFAAWTAYGLAAYGVYRVIHRIDPAFLSWRREGPIVAGLAIVAAGLYQLTPLKQACLAVCRSPFDFVINHWRDGAAGALRMGLSHGLYCLGCCWILMALLFVGGVMNLLWVAVLAAVVLVEKLFPLGFWMARIGGVLLAAYGIGLLAMS